VKLRGDIIVGDCLESLRGMPDESVNCCVTSPPYWGLRDYGVDGQLGLEKTPVEYVENMVNVFREVNRVLRNDGTLWLNLGDCYASSGGTGHQVKQGQRASRTHTQRNILGNTATSNLKSKDLVGIPWRVAFALQANGWYLRSDIIWHKPNPMPDSTKDRPTKCHEYIFLLSKRSIYYFDNKAVAEPAVSTKGSGNSFARKERISVGGRGNDKTWNPVVGGTRNIRTVWKIGSEPFSGAHFATFPTKLITPCVLAGCPVGGVVLDPFFGAGTTGLVAHNNGRGFVGIELNTVYAKMAKERIFGMFAKCSGPEAFERIASSAGGLG
jgi:DNA modification methylase